LFKEIHNNNNILYCDCPGRTGTNAAELTCGDMSKPLTRRIWTNWTEWPAAGVHVDGLTDTTKQMVAFRNFSNAPKNGRH